LPYFHNLGLLFSWVAEHNGEKPALVYDEQSISFSELNQLQLRLVVTLSEYGLGHGDRVAIVSSKGVLTYGLMLACLRLGISYVNLDAGAPIERNQTIIEASKSTRVFIEDPSYLEQLETKKERYKVPSVLLSDSLLGPNVAMETQSADAVLRIDSATIAYVMYTSGSTGVPKGVAISHQNVLHFISWIQSRFEVTPKDRISGLNPLHFDNSVFDFYGSVFAGASLVPIRRELIENPGEMMRTLERARCTIWFSVPSLLIFLNTMRVLNSRAFKTYRYIIFGGEGFPKTELQKLSRLIGPSTKLINVYGPTECTCICSAYEVQASDLESLDGLPPLGHLNQNIDYLILNEDGMQSELGELCLIGDNVALGYLNDIERTATSFSILETSERYGKRMYRTGDIVNARSGVLLFVGRKDNQIKHLGYRIELEEIELALGKHPDVIQAAAVYTRTNASYGRIIAFISSPSRTLREQQVLEFARKQLPSYMVPSRVAVLEDLPKNQNGKVDRIELAKRSKDAPLS